MLPDESMFPDGYVNAKYHRAERERWQAELDEKSRELDEVRVQLEALRIEHKQLKGMYSNVVNNYGASKAKYDRAQESIREAWERLPCSV